VTGIWLVALSGGAEPTDNKKLIYHKDPVGSNPKKGLDKRASGVLIIQIYET
jgi:hypothetical protein